MADTPDVHDWLWPTKPEDYGPGYEQHLLAQYQTYIEMAERIGVRRNTTNTFFLTTNVGIISAAGIIEGVAGSAAGLGIAGFLLSVTWWLLVRSYRQLARGKFIVINTLETRLPAAPYTAERKILHEGKRMLVFLPLTHIETWIPLIFAATHVFVVILALCP